MKTTLQLVTEYKTTTDRGTWYQAAQDLDISENMLYLIRTKRAPLPAPVALRIAKKLKYPEDLILLWLQVEKMQDKELAPIWERIAANYEAQILRAG